MIMYIVERRIFEYCYLPGENLNRLEHYSISIPEQIDRHGFPLNLQDHDGFSSSSSRHHNLRHPDSIVYFRIMAYGRTLRLELIANDVTDTASSASVEYWSGDDVMSGNRNGGEGEACQRHYSGRAVEVTGGQDRTGSGGRNEEDESFMAAISVCSSKLVNLFSKLIHLNLFVSSISDS